MCNFLKKSKHFKMQKNPAFYPKCKNKYFTKEWEKMKHI